MSIREIPSSTEPRCLKVDKMKVLVAIDSSRSSQDVVNSVATHPWPAGTAFCVLSVVDMNHWEGLPALIDDATHQAESLVKSALDKLIPSGYETTSKVQQGFPKLVIPEYAKQWGADLIVIGSQGHNALSRFLLGSVAQTVLRTSPCSVAIIRPDAANPQQSHALKILVATDGSTGAVKAVYSVANRPWPKDSQVRIISVAQLTNPELLGIEFPLISEYPASLLDLAWKEGHIRAIAAVSDARKILAAAGLQIEDDKKIPEGDARSIILDDAKEWGADLIVLGCYGRHSFERLLMGSVSEAVALHAHCSVEVVR